MGLRFKYFPQIAALTIIGPLIALNASGGGFRDSNVNTPNSVRASSVPGMQWVSFLSRRPGRQWAEKIIGSPMERSPTDIGPIEKGFQLVFSIMVPRDWVVTDELTKIHTFHPSIGASNIYRIYIKGDQFYFLSAGHHYFAPIEFGVEQTFYVNSRMAYANSDQPGWVEVFIDQIPIGSRNPLPGQFVPRHTVNLPDGEFSPYLQIGVDTLSGMPDNVPYRRLFWSLKSLIY